MKSRTFASILILVLAVMIVTGSCATSKKAYVATENEEFYGTWVNPDYDEGIHPGKLVVEHGKFAYYTMTYSTHSCKYGEYYIADKWTDSEGNIWYKYVDTLTITSVRDTNEKYGLAKINKSGSKLEIASQRNDYPTELDPDSLFYTLYIYYRQE